MGEIRCDVRGDQRALEGDIASHRRSRPFVHRSTIVRGGAHDRTTHTHNRTFIPFLQPHGTQCHSLAEKDCASGSGAPAPAGSTATAPHARSVAGRSLSTPRPASAPRATASPAIGRIRAYFFRYLSACIGHARPTRPAFLHIPDSQNPTCVVRGRSCGSGT